jgi:hypothetical protein
LSRFTALPSSPLAGSCLAVLPTVAGFRSVILSYTPIGSRGYAERLRIRRSFAARCSSFVWSTAQPKRHDPFARLSAARLMRLRLPQSYARFKCRFAGVSVCRFSFGRVLRARVRWSRGGGGEMESGCAGGVSRNGRKDKMLTNTDQP